MKQKIFVIFVILVCSFLIIPVKTYADKGEVIYEIESLASDVTGGKITFKGWAFIHKYDNDTPEITLTAVSSLGSKMVKATNKPKDFYDVMVDSYEGSYYHYNGIGFEASFDAKDIKPNTKFVLTVKVAGGQTSSTDVKVFSFRNKIAAANAQISNLSNQAYMSATNAHPQKSGGGRIQDQLVFLTGANGGIFTIYSISGVSSYSTPARYNLNYSSAGLTNCRATTTEDGKFFYAKPGDGCRGVAFGSWIKVQGNPITMTITNKCMDPAYATANPTECGSTAVNECGGTNTQSVECSGKTTYNGTCSNEDAVYSSTYDSGCRSTGRIAVCTITNRTEQTIVDTTGPYGANAGMGFGVTASFYGQSKYNKNLLSAYYSYPDIVLESHEEDYSCWKSCATLTEPGCKYLSTCTRCVTDRTGPNPNLPPARATCDNWQNTHKYTLKPQVELNVGNETFVSNPSIPCSTSVARSGSTETITETCGKTTVSLVPQAYKNLKTGDIIYGNNPGDENYVAVGERYFLDFYQDSGSYPVSMYISNLGTSNIFKGIYNWSLNYDCHYNCDNKYQCDPATSNCGNNVCDPAVENCGSNERFGFYYRPIALDSPFPNRSPGSNWVGRQAMIKADTYSAEKLEYSVTLNPIDMANIRAYNKKVGTYLDDSLNLDGSSNFLKNTNEVGLNIQKGLNLKYARLGEK